MKIVKFAVTIGVASANFQRDLQNSDSTGPEMFTTSEETLEIIPILDSSSWVSMGVSIQMWDMVYPSNDGEANAVQLLVFFDYLTGLLDDGTYYQSYYQFPSPSIPGKYESFTCTSKFNTNVNPSEEFGVLTYEGTEEFNLGSEDSIGQWYNIHAKSLLPDQNMENGGW